MSIHYPVSGSGIRTDDLLDVILPITTRPGLPPTDPFFVEEKLNEEVSETCITLHNRLSHICTYT